MNNVKKAIHPIPVKSVTAWSDSTVALYWIKGGGQYKQFVKKRRDDITSKSVGWEWRHVPGPMNPSDIASRGCFFEELTKLYWDGPTWLPDKALWPDDIETEPSLESEAEKKATKEIFALALPADYQFLEVLEKFTLWKTTRIMGWISRFQANSRVKKKEKKRLTGPLTTDEIDTAMKGLVKRDQLHHFGTEEFEADRQRLNLQADDDGLSRCRGRIQGDYSIYLPGSSLQLETRGTFPHENAAWGSFDDHDGRQRRVLDSALASPNEEGNIRVFPVHLFPCQPFPSSRAWAIAS